MANAKLLAQLKALENIPWIAPVAAAETVAEIARQLAPVDTGELRDKIKAKHLSRYSQVEAGAKHSGYVEFGTYKMAAQPYLRPAIDQYQQVILSAVAESMNGEIHIAVKGGWVPRQYQPGLESRVKKKRRK
jgi:HK97 gp10 family phage protein